MPHALITAEPEKYWDHLKIRLLTRVSVPALGYAAWPLPNAHRQTARALRIADGKRKYAAAHDHAAPLPAGKAFSQAAYRKCEQKPRHQLIQLALITSITSASPAFASIPLGNECTSN